MLNLSKGDDVGNDDRDEDRHDVISHDSERGMHDDDERHHQNRDEERLSEMDDDDVDKDECEYKIE